MSDYEQGEASSAQPQRKSAFLKGGDSDSSSSEEESDSDSDDSDASSDDSEQPKTKKQSRFLRGASDDSESEEEEKKVIKSARDKRVDEMDSIVRNIENAQRIDDWVAISKGEWRKVVACTRVCADMAFRI